MKNFIRIFIVVFVLIGSTAFFGYWSISKLDRTLDNFGAVYLSNTSAVDLLIENQKNTDLAASSTEMYELFATSTATSTDTKLASSSPETSDSVVAPVDIKLAFNFPQKKGGVYIGCTYPISWQSPEVIKSLETYLVDAGTNETVGPKTGGLAKENSIESGSQILDWKVGVVWPGSYYIKISKINGAEEGVKSKVFSINKMPVGIDVVEKERICEESDGSLM